jgi:hypothetical protein
MLTPWGQWFQFCSLCISNAGNMVGAQWIFIAWLNEVTEISRIQHTTTWKPLWEIFILKVQTATGGLQTEEWHDMIQATKFSWLQSLLWLTRSIHLCVCLLLSISANTPWIRSYYALIVSQKNECSMTLSEDSPVSRGLGTNLVSSSAVFSNNIKQQTQWFGDREILWELCRFCMLHLLWYL